MRAASAVLPAGPRWIDRALESGLATLLICAPLPFGAVGPTGRLAFELAAFGLLALWTVAAWSGPIRLAPARVITLLTALLLVGVVQITPLPERLIGLVSPETLTVREAARPGAAARTAEHELLEIAPAQLDPAQTISVDPGASASALRTGAALVALLIVASHVAAVCGVRRLAAALLFSAAFQALYGLVVLTSGYDRIWNVPKRAYLDAATGTYVNRNHYADYLAMALPVGAALWIGGLRRAERRRGPWLLRLLGDDGSRNVIRLLALLLGLAGLLVSFSRAGIALGILAVAATLWLGTRHRPPAKRLLIVVLALAVALIPLIQLGADLLWTRFERSAEDFAAPGSRASVWRDTVTIARSYPLLGSGFGTFSAVYPRHRSPEVRLFYAHAHNDLLQFAAESGLTGLLLLLALLRLLCRRLFRALRGEYGLLGQGFAAGLIATLLHSLIDFNFHLPANATVAVVLAGALWGMASKTTN